MNKDRALFLGPWLGELGWELFVWHGFLRKLVHECKEYKRIVAVTRTGHELLYADFATDIIPYDPPCGETDMWLLRGFRDMRHFYQYYEDAHDMRFDVIHYDTYKERWWLSEPWQKRQQFVQFGLSHIVSGVDVLMVVRNTNKCNTGFRNWPQEAAQRFALSMLQCGYSVGCVGKKESAACVDGAIDYRDIPLRQLAHVMASSRVVVGPQCGATHFATLCGLPQVCWQTCTEHAIRARETWNPFGVSVCTMPAPDRYWKERRMWLPEDDIIHNTRIMLEQKRRSV
jgi:hypothetical protein